jgi:hypothetical protein
MVVVTMEGEIAEGDLKRRRFAILVYTTFQTIFVVLFLISLTAGSIEKLSVFRDEM